MTEDRRDRLIRLIVALCEPANRRAAQANLARHLGIETVLVFVEDPEIKTLLIAPGFPPTLPADRAWLEFLKTCVAKSSHQATLPYPLRDEPKTVSGLACGETAVIALIGPPPDDETLRNIALLLPLLAAGLQCEQALTVHSAQARLAQQMAKESTSLAEGIDRARRAAQHEIAARIRAEETLRVTRDELSRANAELEMRVQERTARLQETIAELEAFSYSVSHDMRAPLRAMQGYASVLQEDAREKLSESENGYLNRITRSAEKLDRLIQEVLTYSRLSHGEVEMAAVDLGQVVEDALQHYPELQEPNAQVTVELPLPQVLGHEVLVSQCISNLLMNATKFVAPGAKPRVRVWSEQVEAKATLWIADNGIGIAPHNQRRIFRMFQRINPPEKFAGHGIGLTIAKKAVERMGGEMGVISQEGQGSSFWLTFNRAPGGN